MKTSTLLVATLALTACGGFPSQAFKTKGRADAKRQAGTIVVDFTDGMTQADIDALEVQWGVDLRLNSIEGASDGVAIATLPAGADPAPILAKIAATAGVESANEMLLLQASAWTPNDPDYGRQWNFRAVHADRAWDDARGAGVVVAVIDTGVAHADLGLWKLGADLGDTRFVPGYDFVNDRAEAIDDHGHGTHVAGTIAEGTNNGIGPAGLASEAKIMPLKVLAAEGYGSDADIADAIRFATDHGANVINMSLGGGGYSPVMASAVKYAHAHGVVVVCAAGNSGWGEVDFPAAYDGAFAVSSVRLDDQLAPYSSWGKELDLAAPGGDMTVDLDHDGNPDGIYQNTIDPAHPGTTTYAYFQGTSMAAPHVAAVAALVMATGMTDPDHVEAVLLETARQTASDGWNDKTGAGVVDAAAAVHRARMDLGLGRLAALGAVFAALWLGRKKRVAVGPGFVLTSVVTGTGLFFLPLIAPMFPGRAVLELPVMDWGMLVTGASGHSNLLLWSALLPLVVIALLYSVPKLRRVLAGVAAGAAAFLLHASIAGYADVGWLPGGLVQTAWLAGNGLLALGLAWVVLKKNGIGE